jgi:AcrR family transcriptional regulator
MARRKGSVGSETKATILAKALQMIAQYGYAAVSMRMIADAVGVNVGALYNHFPSKQHILVFMMSNHMDGLLAAWSEVDTQSLTPAQRLDSFVRFHIGYNIGRADDVFISFMELRSLEAEGHKQIEKKRRAYEDVVRMIIRDGQKLGQFHVEDAHVAAMSVLGSLIGVNTWYRAKGRLSKQKIEDYYSAMSLRSVGYEKAGELHV